MESDPVKKVKTLEHKPFVSDKYVEGVNSSKWEKQELTITEISDEKNLGLQEIKRIKALAKEIENSLAKIGELDNATLSTTYGKSLRLYTIGAGHYEETLRKTNKRARENHIIEKVENYKQDLLKKYVNPFLYEIKTRREKGINQ
ncbi:MAG TPA: hypothetical protein VHO47_00385 [Candidatus Babeliales bacterium]|nr:hypothetical protein [Candidatus Babeliales bacterium]